MDHVEGYISAAAFEYFIDHQMPSQMA